MKIFHVRLQAYLNVETQSVEKFRPYINPINQRSYLKHAMMVVLLLIKVFKKGKGHQSIYRVGKSHGQIKICFEITHFSKKNNVKLFMEWKRFFFYIYSLWHQVEGVHGHILVTC